MSEDVTGLRASEGEAADPECFDAAARAVPGGTDNVQDIFPLTPLQEGILFHSLLEERKHAYVLLTFFELRSASAIRRLASAVRSVIRRHDVLRAAVLWEDLPRPLQVILRELELPIEDAGRACSDAPLRELKEKVSHGLQHWDLSKAPLMKLWFMQGRDTEISYAALQVHHLVCDYHSNQTVLAEIIALSNGSEALPAVAPFRDFVMQSLAASRARDAEAFFTEKLGDFDEIAAPFDLVDVVGENDRLAHDVVIDGALAKRIRARAQRSGASAAALVHAAWGLVVASTSRRDDVVYGTVVLASRQRMGGARLPRVVGPSINTLPLRVRLRGLTARELLESTRVELGELVKYESTSLTLAQKCSGLKGNAPLFTCLLNYNRSASASKANPAEADGAIRIVGSIAPSTNYPITMSVVDCLDRFELRAQVDARLDPARIAGYVTTALRSLVEALEERPDEPALSLAVVPEEEREQLERVFNATASPYPHDQCVHELFEEQARRTPDRVAAEFQGRSLTYAQLNSKANHLARELLTRGLVADDLVGICVERGLEMVVGLVGILRAGAAYVPLDPNYPPDRLRYMMEDAAPRIVLTQKELRSHLPAPEGVELIELDIKNLADEGVEKPSRAAARPESLAYVIYTSGSTGLPKGTEMWHRSLVNLIEWHRHTLDAEGQRVLQFAALSFDVAFQETFTTLCTGGTLLLLGEWVRRDASALVEFLSDQRVERLFLPPLMLQSLAEQLQGASAVPGHLRDVITAGEQLRVTPQIRELFNRLAGCRLHNHYGPTETHVVTALTLTGEPGQWPELPSIGRPIANSQIYVLDEQRRTVPLGVAGEIYIGGAGVARGYLRRPELTGQRFITDTPGLGSNGRLYKTGDLGRWADDAALGYLGRNDDQVKIRGFRVEPREIEAQLLGHEHVKEAVVVAREDVPGERRLVAYFMPADAEVSIESLRTHLQGLVPDYMVPSAFVSVKSWPRTPSGKLDRRALPAPQLEAYVTRAYEPPRDEVEQALADIWKQLLRIERVGRDDNFFELGGHSLLMMPLMGKLKEAKLHASIRTIFESASLADLARVLKDTTGGRAAVPVELGERPALECEFDEGAV